jgi:hypothetical protein
MTEKMYEFDYKISGAFEQSDCEAIFAIDDKAAQERLNQWIEETESANPGTFVSAWFL